MSRTLRARTFGLLCILWGWSHLAAAETRPNFLLILADDLGWGDLASYGHPVIRTPHLDRLAQEGVRFTNAYAAAPVCSPARVGLLTGRDPNRAGIYDWIPDPSRDPAAKERSRDRVHLRKEEITLPAQLQRAGYATALAGKWHCNARFNDPAQPQPDAAGFDYWFATASYPIPTQANPTNFVRNGDRVGALPGFSCDLVADDAIAWLGRHHAARPQQPFFLYVALHEPHEDVVSPPDLVAAYRAQARNENEAHYFANVAAMDRAIGRLLATLDRLKLAENTLVFFTSDNGPETLNRAPWTPRSYGRAGPLRGMKLSLFEGGVRVPAILRWPAGAKAGRLSHQPISALDVLPTFAALGGASLPPNLNLDGADFRSAWDDQPVRRTRPLFWIYFNALGEPRVALREGPWKLLARLDGGQLPRLSNITTSTAARVRAAPVTDFSLYQLTNDIGETCDLSAAEPARVAEMSATMERLYRELTATMHVWPD